MTRRRSAQEWEQIVDAWLASGQSRSAFAARVGVNASTLGWWRWRLDRDVPARRDESEQSLSFAGVVVDEEPARDFVVELPGALHLRVPHGFDAAELRRLVAALC